MANCMLTIPHKHAIICLVITSFGLISFCTVVFGAKYPGICATYFLNIYSF